MTEVVDQRDDTGPVGLPVGELDRTSVVARLAASLRQQIIDGALMPGTRLAEQAVARHYRVSRHTLREAFRLLSDDHLLVHEEHRGVFVRTLGATDIAEIYTTRRLVECAAVEYGPLRPETVTGIRAAVRAAQADAAARRWRDVGTSDLQFHSAITALAGSRRLDDLMRRMLAELRLAFHVMDDPQRFHEPYLHRNDHIAGLIERDDRTGAVAALREYLDDAEQQLLAGIAERSGPT
ncbi:MAG: GntR family transcriptional regulator [Actinocatenispora sp.]